MKRILILYWSDAGSTKEVASFIGEALSKSYKVEVKSGKDPLTLDDYDSMIIGAPVNGFAWKSEAIEFLKGNVSKLKNKDLFYFALAMCARQARPFFKKLTNNALNKPSKVLKPRDKAVFSGRSQSALPTLPRMLFGLPKDLPQDQRNWQEIKEWADKIAALFAKKL